MYIIAQGICNVKKKGVINVKWAMALLHFSVWVQLKMSSRWIKEKVLSMCDDINVFSCKELRDLFGEDVDADGVALCAMIVSGAGGTGKTTSVKLLAEFADFV